MKRKALFVGVNEYKDPAIRNLKCSVRDAISMHDIFEMFGYETRLLENPSKVDVFNAIRDMAEGAGGLKAGDQFLLYFSGHGFTDSGEHLLFCADDMYKHLRHHRAGIPFGLVEEETRTGGYDRVFLLDACQSDFLTSTKGCDMTTKDLVAIGDMMPKAEDATGAFYVLRSCSRYEHAIEVESAGHGLFTLGMLDVLRQSKENGTELLFDDCLRETVREKMGLIARSAGVMVRQTPESDGRGCPQILIGGRKVPPPSVPSLSTAAYGIAPTLVVCPVCGKKNDPRETFKCHECGRDNLCLEHQDNSENCCTECVTAKRRKLKAENRKRIRSRLQNLGEALLPLVKWYGLLLVGLLVIGLLGLVFWGAWSLTRWVSGMFGY